MGFACALIFPNLKTEPTIIINQPIQYNYNNVQPMQVVDQHNHHLILMPFADYTVQD